MLYKLIDRSTGVPRWTWIAEVKGSKVRILYGRPVHPNARWEPFDPNLTANVGWRDWENWAPDVWTKLPLSQIELFAELL